MKDINIDLHSMLKLLESNGVKKNEIIEVLDNVYDDQVFVKYEDKFVGRITHPKYGVSKSLKQLLDVAVENMYLLGNGVADIEKFKVLVNRRELDRHELKNEFDDLINDGWDGL